MRKQISLFIFLFSLISSRVFAQCISCSSSTLSNGVVFCLPFNGNANDESGNGFNGTVSGATLINDRFGKANKAYRFNGSSNYIDLVKLVPDFSSISFSAWIRPANNNSMRQFIFYEGDANCGNDYYLVYKDGKLYIAADKNGSTLNATAGAGEITLTSSILNQWTHVVWTMSASKSLVYINGTLVSTINKTASNSGYHYTPTIASVFDGGGAPCGSPRSQFFNGDIDDILMYNRILTSAEVMELYSCSPSTLAERAVREDVYLTAFPNPAVNYFNLHTSIELENSSDVLIYNSLGQQVSNYTVEPYKPGVWQINSSALNAGVYFISVRHKQFMYNTKIYISK